jgi:hypothetical protein
MKSQAFDEGLAFFMPVNNYARAWVKLLECDYLLDDWRVSCVVLCSFEYSIDYKCHLVRYKIAVSL